MAMYASPNSGTAVIDVVESGDIFDLFVKELFLSHASDNRISVSHITLILY